MLCQKDTGRLPQEALVTVGPQRHCGELILYGKKNLTAEPGLHWHMKSPALK